MADLYDLPELYDTLLPVDAHLPYYLDLARRQDSPVLELACGTGQLAVPIAATGITVAGLDRSAAMLDVARARAAAAGVSIDLVEGDMRGFDLGRRFALVFVARNSLLHLTSTDDLLAALVCAKAHLAPGGILAFDVFNPSPMILARPRGTRFPVMQVPSGRFGTLRVEGTHDYSAAEQVDRGTWYISTAETPDRWVVPITMRSIFPQELPLLVEAGGLRLTERFGDLSGRPFGATSPQQVCLCEAAS